MTGRTSSVCAELRLSIAANGARDILAIMLRDHRLPGHPTAVKKDGDRVRCWWLVEMDDRLLRPRSVIHAHLGTTGPAELAGYMVAPVVFNLFRDPAFDARWKLVPRPDMEPS